MHLNLNLTFHQLKLEVIIDGEEMEKVICLILQLFLNFKIQLEQKVIHLTKNTLIRSINKKNNL